ncbi:NADH-quinone oxidoreductase subunit NuoG [Deinococcus roseus]|uniref:NADH-quinone oxidoreductase n=1 Tax=Deinococcus roseus TaxID=392414 RepID=A0ABQ2CUG4_9DEIO|nr:NADH-quinone oxidoreductase subunit NuoG [Deinococcus roseus]GGJ20471.1 NADH-quinone oxidoreductase [Deinococcus roseus]
MTQPSSITVIVDGREVQVPAGTSAIDAVFQAGRDVPYFCSQQYLSPVGACRMCLVEAGTPRKNPDGSWILDEQGNKKIFYFPKPMASCTLGASDGMVIKTLSEGVKKAQAGMMEFTLINHPLDCPTCDKGGACELQDRAFEYGYGVSRFQFDRRHAEKHYELSEFVVLDQERCIHCKRCVRYFEEVPNQEVLDFIERGGHTFIDTIEGGLPSNFSGNITDICPVGALLDNVARFRGRNWEYDHTATTCTACSVGCSITVDARNGRLERIVGRDNPEVNEQWLCDGGRFGHPYVDDGRLTQPLIKVNGQFRPATWEEAIAAIRTGLDGVSAQQMGFFTRADITLEEGIALEAFVKQVGTPNVDHAPRHGVVVNAPAATLLDVATADAIVVIGADLSEEAPVVDLRVQEMLKGGVLPLQYDFGTAIADLRLTERMHRYRERLAVFYPTTTRMHGVADISAEMNSIQVLEHLSSVISGQYAGGAIEEAAALLKNAKKPVIILGSDVLKGGQIGLDIAAHIALSSNAKVLPIPADSNGVGLSRLEIVPQQGADLSLLGTLKAALVSRLTSIPEDFSGFLVVHETQLTEVAKRAHVVLPALTNYEKRGTTVNLEGRLLKLEPAAISSGESADLITALGAVAEALSLKAPIRGQRSAQKALKDRFGVDVADLPAQGKIVDLGRQYNARTSKYHRPEVGMWKETMLRSERLREKLGGSFNAAVAD